MSGLFNPERWVVTGLLWAGLAFPLTLAVTWLQGEAITGEDILLQAALWAAGGLAFGQALRFISRRNPTNAR